MTLRSTVVSALTAATLLAFSGSAQAQRASAGAQNGTEEERAACGSDVFQFCQSTLGNRKATVDCLLSNKSRLSESCRRLVQKRGG